MAPKWVRWTVIFLAVVLACALALSVVPSDAREAQDVRHPPVDYQFGGAHPSAPASPW